MPSFGSCRYRRAPSNPSSRTFSRGGPAPAPRPSGGAGWVDPRGEALAPAGGPAPLLEAGLGARGQLVGRAVLDRLRGTGLGARGRQALLGAVVAERALEDPAVSLALVDHAERARRHAVATAVADVVLHHDGAEL